MPPAAEPIGLIAGGGRMPFLVAAGIRQAGRPLIIAALRGHASRRLADLADDFNWVGITRLGSWLRLFRNRGVREAVMIGSVRKREMYSPLRLLQNIPDLRSVGIWYRRLRKDKRDNAVLLTVADELQNHGIELVSSVKYCCEHLAIEGLMTRRPVPRSAAEDVEFGWAIARACAKLDVGQAVAVKERDIIAVEAIEGTDAMIRRAGQLCPVGGWTLVKVARPNQDMRADVPTVGPGTIRNLAQANGICLVVEAGKTIIVDKQATLALADKLKIAVLGRCGE